MPVVTYTRLCIQCPPGQQRGLQRATRQEAVADATCQHTGRVLETWTRYPENPDDDELLQEPIA